jgi:hypothetical protein
MIHYSIFTPKISVKQGLLYYKSRHIRYLGSMQVRNTRVLSDAKSLEEPRKIQENLGVVSAGEELATIICCKSNTSEVCV